MQSDPIQAVCSPGENERFWYGRIIQLWFNNTIYTIANDATSFAASHPYSMKHRLLKTRYHLNTMWLPKIYCLDQNLGYDWKPREKKIWLERGSGWDFVEDWERRSGGTHRGHGVGGSYGSVFDLTDCMNEWGVSHSSNKWRSSHSFNEWGVSHSSNEWGVSRFMNHIERTKSHKL